MRIAVVTTSFPSSADDPSGHFVLASARALARSGHDVHVIAPGRHGSWSPAQTGLTVHRSGGGALFGWPGMVARAREAPWRLAGLATFAAGVRRALCEHGPFDRAVGHWLTPSAWPLLTGSAHRGRIEAVAHGGDVRALLSLPALGRRRILRALFERDVELTFASRASRDALARTAPGALGSWLIAARVEPPPFELPDVGARAAEIRGSLGLEAGERMAIAVGRLVPSKRIHLALDAVRAAARAGTALRLVVVGDGPERGALERRGAALPSPPLFVGIVPRGEALAWIGASDVLIHPSSAESAPTAVREARALGVRVVACDAGDVREWAERDGAISIVPPTADDLARALGPA